MAEFFAKGLVNESEFVRARINVSPSLVFGLIIGVQEVWIHRGRCRKRNVGHVTCFGSIPPQHVRKLIQANPLPASMWYMLHVLASPSRDTILKTISQHATDTQNPCADSFNLDSMLTDPLLHALFSETLRLQATTLTVRGVTTHTTLPVIDDEYFIRKGTILIAPASALHMDEEIFPNPKTFRSDRFYGHGDIESVHIPGTGEGDYATATTANKPTTTTTTKVSEKEVKDKRVADIPGALIGRKDARFKKNGVVVKHNLIPFGGGDHLVSFLGEKTKSSVREDGLQSMRSLLGVRLF